MIAGFIAGFLFLGFEIIFLILFNPRITREFHVYNLFLPWMIFSLSGLLAGFLVGYASGGGQSRRRWLSPWGVIICGILLFAHGFLERESSHFSIWRLLVLVGLITAWTILTYILSSRAGKTTAISMLAILLVVGIWSIVPAVSPSEFEFPPEAAERRSGDPPNFLLIVVDTLRRDHLGVHCNGVVKTPAIDSLAAAGVIFEDARTPVPLTLPSHTSLLTGTYPPYHGVRANLKYSVGKTIPLLQEELTGAGYQTAAFVSAKVLAGDCGLDRGFSVYNDRLGAWWKKLLVPEEARLLTGKMFDMLGLRRRKLDLERPASETVGEAVKWLGKHHREKFFLWVHLFEPHAPLTPPKRFENLYKGSFSTGDDIDNHRMLYKAEVSTADNAVGTLLTALRKYKVSGNTVVVFTSDHGQALGERNGYIGHAESTEESTLKIPLILSWPGKWDAGSRLMVSAENTDLFPTLLSVAGIRSKATVFGKNLVQFLDPGSYDGSGKAHSYRYFETMNSRKKINQWQGFVDSGFKYVRNLEDCDEALFDLEQDPHELTNLAGENRLRTELMRTVFDSLLNSFESVSKEGSATENTLSREDIATLKALGYIN